MKNYRRKQDGNRKKADETRDADAEQQVEPASFVPLLHAMAYCNWLSRQEGIPESQWCYAGDKLAPILNDETFAPLESEEIADGVKLSKTGYRLPTEAEWEYACRSGAGSSRHFGDLPDLLGTYAHHRHNSPGNFLAAAGRHAPNEWGLFDMLGNVAEWCHADPSRPKPDRGPSTVGMGVIRGGSIHDEAVVVRSSYRILVPLNAAQRDIGFRVVRTLQGE
jgi:formylglycine-generating enzyme required for sulfatase activity